MTAFQPLITDQPLPQTRAARTAGGLLAWDTARTFEGYVLVAPSLGGNTVHLVNLWGESVHTWTTPFPLGLDVRLTPEGTLFCTGKTPGPHGHFAEHQPWKGGWVGELDWDSNVLWGIETPLGHHSAELLANGNVLAIVLEELPKHVADAVEGGRPGSEWQGTHMYADALVELTKQGEEVRRWSMWKTMRPEDFPLTTIQEDRVEWTHCNSAEELPNGNFLVSFRTTSTVAEIHRETGDLVWSIGAPLLAQQHAPTLLPNGNILIFDNGTHRIDHYLPYSRVLEINPVTHQVHWSYQDALIVDFYSPLTANAQRLPNGNTLIVEATFGRIFEVNAEKDVVWEYISPYFETPHHNPDLPSTNRLFRAYKYSTEQIARYSKGHLLDPTKSSKDN